MELPRWEKSYIKNALAAKGVTCGRNSAVECQLPKLDVAGSTPVARSHPSPGASGACTPFIGARGRTSYEAEQPGMGKLGSIVGPKYRDIGRVYCPFGEFVLGVPAVLLVIRSPRRVR